MSDTNLPPLAASASLPREVLRWIQSLDLTYAVKHIRRDFSNGFLVAEIFNRYYAKEVTMHSFDNGISTKVKKDNWGQLSKIFRKLGFTELLSPEESVAIINCDDNSTIEFVCKIFELLTKRKVQSYVKKSTVGRVAGYAQDISVGRIRNALKTNDLTTDDADRTSVGLISSAENEAHEMRLRSDRVENPSRYAVVAGPGGGKQREQAVPKSLDDVDVDEEEEALRVRVTEIQVKQLDRNITHIRATKHMQRGLGSSSIGSTKSEGEGGRSSPGGGRTSYTSSDYMTMDTTALGTGLVPENSISILNACIARILKPGCHALWVKSAEPIDNLYSALSILRDGNTTGPTDVLHLDALVTSALEEIKQSSQPLADACIVTPKQFWKVSDLFCNALRMCPHKQASFTSAVSGFAALGEAICSRDSRTAFLLFFDFALPKLTSTLANHAYKRLGILQVFSSFHTNDASSRIQSIHHLQNALQDVPAFIYCLAVTASREIPSSISDVGIDLYVYYASIGLTNASPKLRSAAISILTDMLAFPDAKSLVYEQIGSLSALSKHESWWECQAHILSFCGAFITSIGTYNTSSTNADMDTHIDTVLEMIRNVLRTDSTRAVREWGLHTLAKASHFGEPVASMLLDVAISLSDTSRQFLLGSEDDTSSNNLIPLGLPSSTGIDFILGPLTTRWNPVKIAKALETSVRLKRLDRLEPEHIEILNACVHSSLEQGKGRDLGKDWLELYSALVDYIFVALCDEKCVHNAMSIVMCFVHHSSLHEIVLQENRFIGMLRLMYPVEGVGNVICQTAMESFFTNLFASKGRKYDRAVTGLLGQFWKSYPTQFERSNLYKLLNDFTSLMGK